MKSSSRFCTIKPCSLCTTVPAEVQIIADPKDNTIYSDELLQRRETAQPKRFRQKSSPMLVVPWNGDGKVTFVKDANGNWLLYLDYRSCCFTSGPRDWTTKYSTCVDWLQHLHNRAHLLFWPVAAILASITRSRSPSEPGAARGPAGARCCLVVVLFSAGLDLVALNAREKHQATWARGDSKCMWLDQIIGLLTGVGA